MNVTVTNKAGSGPITLTGTSIGGANSGDFAVTGGSCTGTLGGVVELHLRGNVYAEHRDCGERHAFDRRCGRSQRRSGGSRPERNRIESPLKALPASIAFGTIAGGHSSVNKTVTVYNDGGAAVPLSESISGTNQSDFTVTGGTCVPR